MRKLGYSSKIEMVEGPALRMEIQYQRKVTTLEAELFRAYFVDKFSEKAGRQVKPEEVSVGLEAGELATLDFITSERVGKPLYLGWHDLKEKAPYALRRAIRDLKKLSTEQKLLGNSTELVDDTVRKLEFLNKTNVPLNLEIIAYNADSKKEGLVRLYPWLKKPKND